MRRDPRTGRSDSVMMSHGPLRLDQHGNACWDCSRPLGVRVAVTFRGMNEDGTAALFALCARCAKREAHEIETGKASLRTRITLLLKRKK